MTPLDQSFIDLCERHNLANASVCLMRADHGTWFHGAVQWNDEGDYRRVATHNADSFVDALDGAVARMLALRGEITIPTDALELAA